MIEQTVTHRWLRRHAGLSIIDGLGRGVGPAGQQLARRAFYPGIGQEPNTVRLHERHQRARGVSFVMAAAEFSAHGIHRTSL